ncbi:transglutaminase-like domain-containing protein, partial [Nodularia spumigena]|uniref:transglutaminase-like domain-containing protein n=1 Tax=Nodularia spumigena TaxID=70799 RepID=UPI002B1FB9C8
TALSKAKLDMMAKTISNDVINALDSVEQMNILLHYVFQTEKFEGCGEDLFQPEYSYLHRVLEQKKGIPISLAMIVLALAHRLELPFFGINMPLHFILMFESEQEVVYIDPFQAGKFLS